LSRLPPLLDTRISGHIGEEAILNVRGYSLMELAEKARFEEMAYLLLHESLPGHNQLLAFSSSLSASQARVPGVAEAVLQVYDGHESPIDVISSCLAAVSSTTRDPLVLSHSQLVQNATSVIGLYAALLSRYIGRRNRVTTRELKGSGFVEDFLAHCFGEKEAAGKSAFLDPFLVVVSEQALAASTFTARNAASTRAGFLPSVIAGMQAWNGYRHGAASKHVCDDLAALGGEAIDPTEYRRRWRATGIPAFGFGHRRYKSTEDPRVPFIAALGRDATRRYGGRFLKAAQAAAEHFRDQRRTLANADLYAAVLLDALGFRPDEIPAVVLVGRLAGMCAHIIEENGPMRPLLRGESLYNGPSVRPVPGLDSRTEDGSSRVPGVDLLENTS